MGGKEQIQCRGNHLNKGTEIKAQSCVLGPQAGLYCTVGIVGIGLKIVETGSCE